MSSASVQVKGELVSEIGSGLLILLGVSRDDTNEDCLWLVDRVKKLRIFDDAEGKMNRSILETKGNALVVSQFTLFGTVKKGTRPSFNRAAPPEIAVPLYEKFIRELGTELGRQVAKGVFGASMAVKLVNDGPVTLILDSREKQF